MAKYPVQYIMYTTIKCHTFSSSGIFPRYTAYPIHFNTLFLFIPTLRQVLSGVVHKKRPPRHSTLLTAGCPLWGDRLPATTDNSKPTTLGDRSSARVRHAWSLVQQVWQSAAECSVRQPEQWCDISPRYKSLLFFNLSVSLIFVFWRFGVTCVNLVLYFRAMTSSRVRNSSSATHLYLRMRSHDAF